MEESLNKKVEPGEPGKVESEQPGETREPEPGKTEKENDINDITNRQKRKNAFLESLENGVSVLKASKAAGIAYKTIWRWRKDDSEFDDAINAIMEARIMIVEDALFLNAAKGNLGAQIFWLKNRSGGRWKDKTEEDVNLNLKGGLDYKEYVLLKGMTKNERAAFIKNLGEVIGNKNVGDVGEGESSDKKRPLVIKKDNIS